MWSFPVVIVLELGSYAQNTDILTPLTYTHPYIHVYTHPTHFNSRNGTYNHNPQQDDYNEEDAFITQPIKHKPDTETFFPTQLPSNSDTSHQPPTSIHQRNSNTELKSTTHLDSDTSNATAQTTITTSETPQKQLSSSKVPRDRTPSRIPTPTGSVSSGGIGGGGGGARLGSRDSGIMVDYSFNDLSSEVCLFLVLILCFPNFY